MSVITQSRWLPILLNKVSATQPAIHASINVLRSKVQEHETFMKDFHAEKDPEILSLYEQERELHEKEIMRIERDTLLTIREGYEKATKILSETDRDCVIEIRPGSGGAEAMMFAEELWEMYENFAESRNWKFTSINVTDTLRVAEISGHNAPFRTLQCESGVHRVQRVPSNEAKGKLQTSAASVVVLPAADDNDLPVIPAHELKTEVKKSSGPGGQSVNTAFTAVRMTHIPTGIFANVLETSSQIDNKKIALQMIRTKLWEKEREQMVKKQKDDRKSSIGSGDRSEKIRTYNFPRDDVQDHRWKHPAVGAHEILYESGLEILLESWQQEVFEVQILEDAIAWVIDLKD